MIALFRTGFNGVVYGFERSLAEYLVRHYLAHARLRHLLAMRRGVGVETIALQAATDMCAFTLVHRRLVGRTAADKPLHWPAAPGSFVVRAVDDQGHADVRALKIDAVK